MNLKELDSFKISDAISFHDTLNPKLWAGNKLRPEVKKQLEAIAEDFLQEMGIHDLDVRDITISGSNAAYSYTDHSDIDLHILVNMKDLPNTEIYKELFNAKKSMYNDSHDITIHGVPVEVYVEDASEPAVTLGEYSIKNDKWLRVPTKRRANFDEKSTKLKYDKLLDIVQRALKSKDLGKIQKVLKKIKQYRQAGLDKGGEFGPENLAFKALRSQGWITKLYELRDKLHSEELTIETMYQQPDKLDKPTPTMHDVMKKHKVTLHHVMDQLLQGIKVESEHTSDEQTAREIALDHLNENPNYYTELAKVGLEEKINPELAQADFYAEKDVNIEGVGPLKFIAKNLYTTRPPQFRIDVLKPDGENIGYFRFVILDYEPETKKPRFQIFSKFKEKKDPYIIGGNVSVSRAYQKKGIASAVYQWVRSMGNDIRPSPTQTDAGKAMWRGFEKHQTVEESASGYIPSYAEKDDPRFKMALTVDIKPDTMMKNAKKLGSKISRAGIPPTLKPSGKF